MQLHFKKYGTGHPLILLHGLLGSLDNWHSMSLKLAETFCVLALDQRNHGHSPHSREMNYKLMANDIAELMNHESLSCAHVLGHSMGGKTAMQFALLYPERISKLIIVDIAPRAYSPRHAKMLSALLALDLEAFSSRTEIQKALEAAIPELTVRQFLLKNLETDAHHKLRWRIGLQEIFQNYESLRSELASASPVQCPALFLRGEESDYLSERDLPLIHRLFPRAELASIPRAGHLPHMENPEAFLQKVRMFLVET